MTPYQQLANASLVEWRRASGTLVDVDLAPSPYSKLPDGRPYGFCLPLDASAHNLLPEARACALQRFEQLGIPWHDGVGTKKQLPSNHLRDSQVQCVNALMPFVDAPESLRWLFGELLPIAEVLQFGDPQAPSDHVVFEWIGLDDYLHEGNGKPRTRGARTTSADAAIRYRATDGAIEIALIEWKYTEAYALSESDPKREATRIRRYRSLWERAVRTDFASLEALFVEPVYQLLRLQMLAREMERSRELDADRVRLVWAAPAANAALFSSLPACAIAPASGAGGPFTDVRDLWVAMQIESKRFDWFDTARFVDGDAPTSAEFKTRYAHLASEPSG